MILDLIEKTHIQLQAYIQAQAQKNQQEAIQNTCSEIIKLEKELDNFLKAYQLRKHFLSDDIIQSTKEDINNIKKLLQESETDFSENKNYKQSITLGAIQKSIETAKNNIRRAWMIYVQQQIQPYQELARIADTLPQMKEKTGQIESLIQQLEGIAKKLPNKNTWSEFESKKQQLAILLDNLHGLGEEKRKFLEMVRSMRASVADLTPDLLKWCNEQDISSSLVVRFKDRA